MGSKPELDCSLQLQECEMFSYQCLTHTHLPSRKGGTGELPLFFCSLKESRKGMIIHSSLVRLLFFECVQGMGVYFLMCRDADVSNQTLKLCFPVFMFVYGFV